MKRILLILAATVTLAGATGCASWSHSDNSGATGTSNSVTNPPSMNEPVTKRRF